MKKFRVISIILTLFQVFSLFPQYRTLKYTTVETIEQTAFSNDGNLFAIALASGQIEVFETRTGSSLATFQHTNNFEHKTLFPFKTISSTDIQQPIKTIFFSSDNSKLISSSFISYNCHIAYKGFIKIWDLKTQTCVCEIGNSNSTPTKPSPELTKNQVQNNTIILFQKNMFFIFDIYEKTLLQVIKFSQNIISAQFWNCSSTSYFIPIKIIVLTNEIQILEYSEEEKIFTLNQSLNLPAGYQFLHVSTLHDSLILYSIIKDPESHVQPYLWNIATQNAFTLSEIESGILCNIATHQNHNLFTMVHPFVINLYYLQTGSINNCIGGTYFNEEEQIISATFSRQGQYLIILTYNKQFKQYSIKTFKHDTTYKPELIDTLSQLNSFLSAGLISYEKGLIHILPNNKFIKNAQSINLSPNGSYCAATHNDELHIYNLQEYLVDEYY